jgi:membrane protease YdiL (CAAX protease family)
LIGASAYVAFIPANLRLGLKVTLVIAGPIAWFATKRIERFAHYTGLMRSFFSVALGVLLTHYISRFLPPHVIGSTTSIAGIGKAKFFEALPIILTILIFHFVYGGDADRLFLKAGNIKFGLLAGGIGVALFLTIAAIQAIGSNLTGGTIWSVLPWILLFTLSNGLLEELWFRALFMKKLEPMIGAKTTLVLTSFVFAVVHISSTYVIDIIQVVAVTFLLSLIWAWVMRRANSIWPAVLIHASGDVLILLGFLAGASL